ncbi:MAG: hypothetical protein HPY84_09510 [Syntrophobacteraceae bacterium]|jgi:hypothetical protein|nr:hypothetical protein [Syntrophobacteraceae bacterium]
MKEPSSRFVWKVFAVRLALGLLGAVVLRHFFFPASESYVVLIMAGLLVFFGYGFEFIRKSGK